MFYKYCISSICGLLGVFSFSPFKFWILGIISFYLLQIIILKQNNFQSFLIGFFWGIGFFSGGVYWIYISLSKFSELPFFLNLLLIFIFIAYLSIYPGIFSYCINKFFPKLNESRFIFSSPAIWHTIEYVRGSLFTGFPWLQFGYTQTNGPLKNIAPIFGVQMITFIFIIIIGILLTGGFKKKILYFLLITIALTTLNFFKKYNWTKPILTKKKIVLIQGNIPQNLKWNEKYAKYNILKYFNLSKPYLGKTDLIIWPESAIINSGKKTKKLLKLINNILIFKKTYLITGIVNTQKKKDKSKIFFNSIAIFGKKKQKKKNINYYKKHHLVPFGEFIPGKKFLKNIFPYLTFETIDFTPGKHKQKPIKIKKINFSANICYEIIFGNLIRDNVKKNTNILITISDDSWFEKSTAPWQHLEIAQMRSIETGLPLLYVSNTGITALIEHDGNVKKIIPQFISSTLQINVQPRLGPTPYILLGNYPIWIFTLFFIIIAYLNKNK